MSLHSRVLGTSERVIELYSRRNPLHFSLVAQLNMGLTPQDLTGGLLRLQHRHPMLSVRVHQASGGEPGFYPGVETVPLRVTDPGTSWQSVVADEQARPFHSSTAPLVRAVLVPEAADGCSVVLTFAHQAVDGMGGLQALLELVHLLTPTQLTSETADADATRNQRQGVGAHAPAEGKVLELPRSQEDLVAALSALDALTDPGTELPSPSPATVGTPLVSTTITSFTGTPPCIESIEMDRASLESLRRRCRQERTTVHAALCVAAATVLHERGREQVNVLSPIDLRRALGLPQEVAVRFTSGRTEHLAQDTRDFWGLARQAHEELLAQRRPDVLRTTSAALAGMALSQPEEAEALMVAGPAAELQVTNLGSVDADVSALRAVWGPVIDNRLEGQRVLGALSFCGVLRLVEVTRDPLPGWLGDVRNLLNTQSRAIASS